MDRDGGQGDQPLSGPWARFVALLDRDEAGTSLALIRVAVGLIVVHTLVGVWTSGAYALLWFSPEHGGYRDLGDGTWQTALLGGPTPEVVGGLWWLGVCGGLLLAAGVGGAVIARVIALVTLWSFLGVADLNSHAGGSYDELLANSLWLLVLAGPTRTGSLACLVRTGAWFGPGTVKLWPRLLFVVQAVVMYGTTGWQKLSVHWVPTGDLGALYYILQQPTWHLRDMRWIAAWYPVTQLATAMSWWWEVLAPVWLFAWGASLAVKPGRIGALLVRGRVRWVFLWIGVVFHLGVHLTMNIGPFSLASLALYPAFVHPHEWTALGRWIRRRWGRA